jgi:hypothetical protein
MIATAPPGCLVYFENLLSCILVKWLENWLTASVAGAFHTHVGIQNFEDQLNCFWAQGWDWVVLILAEFRCCLKWDAGCMIFICRTMSIPRAVWPLRRSNVWPTDALYVDAQFFHKDALDRVMMMIR